MKEYFSTLGDATSQWINAALFNSQNANESLAGRAFIDQGKPFWCGMYKLLNWLYFWEADHCAIEYKKDVSRAGRLLSQQRKRK